MPKKPAKGQSLGERIRTMRERQGVRIETACSQNRICSGIPSGNRGWKGFAAGGSANSDIQRACRGLCLPARGGEKERARKELH